MPISRAPTPVASWKLTVDGRRIRHFWLLSALRPLWVSLLIASVLLNIAVYLTYVAARWSNNDFRLYYAGAEVGLRYGWSHIYDANLHQVAVAALRPVGQWYPLLTPAPIAWLVAPLTLIGYHAAYWTWVAISLIALGLAAWYARPRQYSAALYFVWWAALGALWFSAYEGQVTILMAAALLAGWRLLETRRDILGGVVLAATLFKPHLVLLLPVALLVAGRYRAAASFAAVAGAAALGMLVTLHPDGIQSYASMLLAPEAAGNTADTLRSALAGGPAVLAIQACAVIAVITVAVRCRRTNTVWPVVVSAVMGSFLLATYWHPQDYLVLDAAAAIILAATSTEAGVLVAAAIALVSIPVTPLTSRQTILAWLVITILVLASMGIGVVKRRGLLRPTMTAPFPSRSTT
ncbi:MAG: glycosyltransferase family 87 protein [Candidatus Dormibacterales bacterium]